MKQVISIADFATMLNVINEKIIEFQPYVNSEDPFYQSLLHLKKALEECKVEIEVPDLEVEKNALENCNKIR